MLVKKMPLQILNTKAELTKSTVLALYNPKTDKNFRAT